MKRVNIVWTAILLVGSLGMIWRGLAEAPWAKARASQQTQGTAAKPASFSAGDIDRLLAPIALYPDQLLAQILVCASDPAKVKELNAWVAKNTALKGTRLQDEALKAGFEPSFVALVLFPDTVKMMAVQLDWTTRLGQAFGADRAAVFDSIQRLRARAQQAGTLKTTPQQDVETQTTSSGQQVIVIEPSNPQVIYVPTYNPQTVYTTSTVVVEQQSSSDAVVAGVIGFTAGIAIGAAIDNDYYYGPYGWRGGAYMYNEAWDDWYDHREDAREDWMDHREDVREDRGEIAGDRQEQRTDRRDTTQQQRTERTEARQDSRAGATGAARAEAGTARTSSAQTSATGSGGSGSYQSRGHSSSNRAAAREQSGTRSDAFSGYSSGQSTRSASSRGQRSRSSGGGGGRRR
jgi:hypothetical protein